MYKIIKLKPLQLINPDNKNIVEIEQDDLINYFLSGFCITIHKSQGETYRDKYTIHEWNKLSEEDKNGMNRKLRYTAVSRSDNPNNNIYYRV